MAHYDKHDTDREPRPFRKKEESMAAQRTWTVRAEKGRALTASELMEALELAPPDSQPKVLTVGFSGRIKEITIQTSRNEEKP